MEANTLSYNPLSASIARQFRSGNKAVLVFGPPGVGKTTLGPTVQAMLGYKHLFMIKPGHHDVVDIAGLPVPHLEDKRTHQYPSADMLPPDDLKGGLVVVVDEVGDCGVAQQNLICQWIYEGGMHNYQFPCDGDKPAVFLMTSNRAADKSGAGRIVTKLGNRCSIYTLQPTVEELFKYGASNGWNPTILAFVKMHGNELVNPNNKDSPTFFNTFDPTDPSQQVMPIFASPRSYEFASKLLNYIDGNEPGLSDGAIISDLSSIVGQGVATKVQAFRSVAMKMPDPDAILAGKNIPYPAKTGVMWALTLTLVSKVTKDNLHHLHAYLKQGDDPEYLSLAARVIFDTKQAACAGPGMRALIKDPALDAVFGQGRK